MTNVSLKRIKGFLIFSGLFNIVFAFPLIIPGFTERYLSFMTAINQIIGFSTISYISVINPTHLMLINTAGIDLVLIGLIVLYASINPIERKGLLLLNSIGRTLFLIIIIYNVIVYNLIQLFLIFGIIDLLISIVFVFIYIRLKNFRLTTAST
jgi:hypothetical protein